MTRAMSTTCPGGIHFTSDEPSVAPGLEGRSMICLSVGLAGSTLRPPGARPCSILSLPWASSRHNRRWSSMSAAPRMFGWPRPARSLPTSVTSLGKNPAVRMSTWPPPALSHKPDVTAADVSASATAGVASLTFSSHSKVRNGGWASIRPGSASIISSDTGRVTSSMTNERSTVSLGDARPVRFTTAPLIVVICLPPGSRGSSGRPAWMPSTSNPPPFSHHTTCPLSPGLPCTISPETSMPCCVTDRRERTSNSDRLHSCRKPSCSALVSNSAIPRSLRSVSTQDGAAPPSRR